MSYRRFKITEIDCTPATVATSATLWASDVPTVANVANVAGHNPKPAPQNARTVANIANVAGAQAYSESSNGQAAVPQNSNQGGGIDCAVLSFPPATFATVATVGASSDQTVANVASVAGPHVCSE